MGLIKEPLDVDFYCDGRQMTDEDQKRVSDYIKMKNERKNKRNRLGSNTTKKTNIVVSNI